MAEGPVTLTVVLVWPLGFAPMAAHAVAITVAFAVITGLHIVETHRSTPTSGHEMVHSVEELRMLVTGMQHRNTPSHAFALKPLIRRPLIVPDTKYAAELVEDMRSNGCHIAILVDEYGGTAGMATLRDLLEALVGRIDDAPLVALYLIVSSHLAETLARRLADS